MTLGLTGVIWLPRGATVNSTTLNAGPGPVPLTAASMAWGSVSANFVDINTTMARVSATLGAAWQGVAAAAALAKIAPFAVWALESSEIAADAGVKAGAQATFNGIARATMPSLPEIVVVKTAKTTAYSTGGALNGTAAAAEAADRAMDIRAGLVMEGYEGATNILAIKRRFSMPPRIVTTGESNTSEFDDASDWERDPVRAGMAALGSMGQNPAVTQAASAAGQAATSAASTATSAVSGLGNSALGNANSNSMMGGAPMFGAGNSSAASTQAASARGGTIGAIGAGAAMPDGWGRGDGSQARGPMGGAPGAAGAGAGMTGGPGAGGFGGGTGAAGNGMMGGRPAGANGSSDDEDDRDTPDYLKSFEHFADGRTVIPSVIGGGPEGRGGQ
ncbi:MAG: PPE domain-containing protein [Rhodococcus sp.]|nr:PPE domain-containing protein [Rhodococcus sp. (in: high G+C Gram-positive bacteria)]